MNEDKKEFFLKLLQDLQDAILNNNQKLASENAQKSEAFYSTLPQKSSLKRMLSFFIGLGFALLAAVIIRQTWFELMEIPSGSMRPTFKEKDKLIVSKSTFGINVPLLTEHFHFQNDLCKRGSIVVFTSKNLNVPDSDMLYFYLFPGKKQFVKRLMGRPKDTLYFYGGQIYGFDQEGNELSYSLPNGIEHIPFIRFEGSYSSAKNTVKQMGQEIITFSPINYPSVSGRLLSSNLYDDPKHFEDYNDLWGFGNYAMARLVPPTLLDPLEKKYLGELSASLLLELHHTPSIAHSQNVHKCVTYIPLDDHHLETLFNNLYTARFIVKNNQVYRYGATTKESNVELSGIPNGTYEFYNGDVYQIFPTGITKLLEKTHPLYEYSIDRLYMFYNIGIELNSYYLPRSKEDALLPSRYAYFRDGDLFVLGQPLLKSGDPTLRKFITLEKKKAVVLPYYPRMLPISQQRPSELV